MHSSQGMKKSLCGVGLKTYRYDHLANDYRESVSGAQKAKVLAGVVKSIHMPAILRTIRCGRRRPKARPLPVQLAVQDEIQRFEGDWMAKSAAALPSPVFAEFGRCECRLRNYHRKLRRLPVVLDSQCSIHHDADASCL